MVQSQFESAGFQGGPPSSGPDLHNNGLVRQMMIDTEIKKNAPKTEPSVLDGLTRMGLLAGGGIKDASANALENYTDPAPDAAMGVGRAEVEIAPDPAQVVKTDGGKKEMKTADTAGDGIVATTTRPSSSSMVKDFAPPAEGRSAEPSSQSRFAGVIRREAPKVELASTMANEVPAAKSKNTETMIEPAEAVVTTKDAAIETAITKPIEISPEAAGLAKKMDATFLDAQKYAKAFEHQRSQRHAEREIVDIETGKRRFTDSAEKDTALESARAKKAAADASLREGVPPRYAQTLKKLHDYTKAVEDYYKAEPNATSRDAMLREAVKKVEDLMSPIDNIWNGIPGKTPDLARPGIRGRSERPMWPEERLPQIQQHLDAKINTVDNAQAQRIGVVKDNLAVKEVLRLHQAGELPKDGSVIFFTNEGTLLYQSELKVSQRSTQARAKDSASAEKHANNTPAFVDVAKIDRGLGPEGAGLWRFIGQENRIVGAAILQPVVKDGKMVELPGARSRNGEATIKKEVSMTIGEIPAEVTSNMAYGHLLNTLRAKKAAIEKGSAPDAVHQDAGPLLGQTGHHSSAAAEMLSKPEGK
ncbi:MAG: hypothetical protein SGJ27_05145 [Candidatus Melainabacteria bacterium]|nr:hypothetical protein [Candidatus Melainabacteria bacterium]